MRWEDYKGVGYRDEDYEETDIECPECGARLLRYKAMVLATYPPMYRYDCKKCGWIGCK